MPGMPGNLLRLCEWMDKVGFESIPLFGRVFAMGFAMGVFFGGLQSRDRGCFWPIQGPCFLEVPITHLLTYSLTHSKFFVDAPHAFIPKIINDPASIISPHFGARRWRIK